MMIRSASTRSGCHEIEISIGRDIQVADVVKLTEARQSRTLN
jgi:hypothetical protein